MATQVRNQRGRGPASRGGKDDCIQTVKSIQPNWTIEKVREFCEKHEWDLEKIAAGVAELLECTSGDFTRPSTILRDIISAHPVVHPHFLA